MKSFIFFIAAFLGAFLSAAQPRTRTQLTGTITDARTGQPVPGASVVLADSRTGAVADSSGHYRLLNIPVGHTILEISSYGYKTLVEHLDISSNDVHDFRLQPSILENEGVTVTAVAGATSIRKAPIAITRVNKAALLSTASTNIVDALSREPGVSQLSTGPAISKPVIRGLGYNRLVVINDGIRQEGQQWGDEHGIEIDENSVSRVEIVKGPASLIYGSDAIAGVINIITTTPYPLNSLRGSILTSFQTNQKQRSLFANIGGNHHGFNWNAWGDYKAAADYRNRYDGHVFNSKFNEKNFGGYAGYNGTWGFSHLIFSSFHQKAGVVEGERDASGAFLKQTATGDATANDEDFSSTYPMVPYQDIRHVKLISDNSFRLNKGRISLTLGWQRNQRREFGEAADPLLSNLHFDLQTVNYNLVYHFQDRRGWTSSAGLNGMLQGNRNRGPEVLIPEYRLFDLGAFAYLQKSFSKTTLSGGIRVDRRRLDSKAYLENGDPKFTAFNRSFANLSSSIGISYPARENFVLKLNLATGFRAPSIPELASNGVHEGTNRYEYGSLNLKSEKSLQADAGIELNSEHMLLTANLFYNSIHDFIFWSRLKGQNGDSLVDVDGELIPAYRFGQRNAGLFGGEVLVDLHPHPIDWLHWQNSLAYVRGRFSEAVEGETDMPLIPATRWTSELRAEFPSGRKILRNVVAQMEMDHYFSQPHAFTLSETETPTGAYTLMNASVSGNIFRKNHVLFQVYLHARNLGDVAYQPHLSRLKYTDVNAATGRRGVFSIGRNFSIKVLVPFSF